jgi:heme oxygenase
VLWLFGPPASLQMWYRIAVSQDERFELITLLREATKEEHAALEYGMKINQPTVTREDYVAFLRASLAALAPFEAAGSVFTDSAVTDRTSRIRSDLEALDARPTHREASARWMPTTTSEAVGCAYVIEGSTLGGLVLAKHLGDRLALEANQMRYLRLHGSETRSRWTAFVDRLETWGRDASPLDRTRACDAAKRTFEVYAQAFRNVGAHDVMCA